MAPTVPRWRGCHVSVRTGEKNVRFCRPNLLVLVLAGARDARRPNPVMAISQRWGWKFGPNLLLSGRMRACGASSVTLTG
jgi:hypothetical protein